MKFITKILAVLALALIAFNASAQFNYFEDPRILVLTYPTNLTASSSNYVIDTHGFEGVGTVTIIGTTNVSVNAMTAQLFSSPDRTNWTAVTYALATSNSVLTTNVYYGSGTPLATNITMRAGTKTTPTASTSGFATSYILPAPYTNVGTVTISGQVQVLGFSVPDAGRYLQVSYVIAGTSTNTVAAIFTGRKQQE